MAMALKTPVGIDDFKDIRKQGFYYIDKTKLIEQILLNWGKVNLFTRPRRFGKTLNMSMLKSFFEIGTDVSLFDGLYISKNKELCNEHMGKYPVIFLTLKGVDGSCFEDARYRLTELIGLEAERFDFLTQSEKLSENEIRRYKSIIALHNGMNIMDENQLISSIQVLSQLLCKHFGQKVIILIDEYDVPLDKAFLHGYYNEMVSLIRGLFGQALKSNDSLQFAILTGCLRVSKESIFTGLNNFKVLSIMDTRFDEHFGFTDSEVREMLDYYGLASHLEEIKEWYNGYHFGNVDIYCPWDVINYIDELRFDENASPKDYWSNSSGNAIVRRFIDKADTRTKDEIERLISGGCIEKDISQELTYDELDDSIEHLWSVLFTTGYLTQQGRTQSGRYLLSIPNREIRNLFIKKIREWFSDTSKKDGTKLEEFCNAFFEKDTEKIEQIFGDYLWNTISIRDTAVQKEKKENFYHGILLGLLGYKENWLTKSNAESGTGYSDILIEIPDNRTGVVIELKYAGDGDMEAACERALEQIEEKQYVDKLKQDGMRNFIKYGIACYKKDCRVVCGKDCEEQLN
nr:AAA family ATPase [uncultured Agathobacter sp.]